MGYYKKLENPSSFRKLAAAMWRPPNDPAIFGFLDLEMSAALDLLARYNAQFGCKVTLTHMVVRAVALALSRYPEVNAKVGWSRIWLRPTVEIFCQVATDGGRDLSGTKIPETDRLSLQQIAARLSKNARAIRSDQDPAYKQSRTLFKTLPLPLLRGALRLLSFSSNTLDLNLPSLGLPRDPFGSAMVTSVGMLGIDSGFAPFTPLARCPMVITVTQLKERPWVVEGTVQVRPVLRLCGTFDHRVIDGHHAGLICGAMEQMFAEPEGLLTPAEKKDLSQ